MKQIRCATGKLTTYMNEDPSITEGLKISHRNK